MNKYFLIIFLFFFFGYFSFAQNNYKDFANIKNAKFIPKQVNDTGIYYSHKGAWFGFSLPNISDTANLGAFGGPYNIYKQEWISEKLIDSELEIKGKGKINLSKAKEINISQLPGQLLQEYIFPDFKYIQRLTNVSSKSYICISEFINLSNINASANLLLEGRIFENIGEGQELKNGWTINLSNEKDGFFMLQFRIEGSLDLAYNEKEYKIKFRNNVVVKPKDTLRLVTTISHYFPGDSRDDIMTVAEAIDNFEKPFEENEFYWNYYINRIGNKDKKMLKLGINALETIWQNYKIQSTTYNNHWFTKNNSSPLWELSLSDVYATSICLTLLEPKLAANQISSFFFWFSDSTKQKLYNEYYFKENNKQKHSYSDFNLFPWLVWNVYSNDTSNIPLIDNTIAEFQNMNDFSFSSQDNNENWFCEDNNTETIKKNTSLFSELIAIRKILQLLNFQKDLDKYNKQISYFTQYFDNYFFDQYTNVYCDINYQSNKMLPNKNAFPFVIWAGLGAYNSVEKYINNNYLNYQITEDNYTFFEQENLFSIFFLLSGLLNYKYKDLLLDIKTKNIEKIEKETINNNNDFFIYENGNKINNSTFAASISLILILYF